MKVTKFFLKALITLVLVVLIVAGGFIGYLSITEYRPDDIEVLGVTEAARKESVQVGRMLNIVTFNTGYGALSRNEDFFMDGGEKVRPDSKDAVTANTSGILGSLSLLNADVYMLQEVDRDSKRSYYADQVDYYQRGLSLNAAYAQNYRCDYVPFPWPTIGKVTSGLLTLSNLNITNATRESLPVPFSWPVRVANLKRCLLIERVPVEGTDNELVLINLHLEAFDDGEGKIQQTKQLMNIIAAEYRNGNYVIVGGDFNQTFEGADTFAMLDESLWQPGRVNDSDLPKGFQFVFDASKPTCRALNKPYDGDRENMQLYVIDGFIISDNLKVNHVETIDLNFKNSDHNPVQLKVTLI